MTDIWPTVHAERRALAEDLTGLASDRWSTPSLCGGWTVQDTVAHLVATAKMTPPKFLISMLSSGFSFKKFARSQINQESRGGPNALYVSFVGIEKLTKAPPGPKVSWLGEILIHGEDIRRPLRIPHTYPMDAVLQCLDFYKGSNALIGTKRRLDGVTLKATDADWMFGEGPMLQGPAMGLLMAATGRKAVLNDLQGPAADILRHR